MVTRIKTIVLAGSEEHVVDLAGIHTEIINFSDDYVYASLEGEIMPGKDNVITIPPQTRDHLADTNGDFYILGTGKIELRGTDYRTDDKGPSPIASSGGSGGSITSGVSQTYVDLQDAATLQKAKEYADSIGKKGTEFSTHLNFPPLGDPDVLYIATDENTIYRWDDTGKIYIPLNAAEIELDDVVFHVGI